MNPAKMLVGLAPWVLFSLLTHLPIDGIAGPAAVAAALSSLAIMLFQSKHGLNIIDATSAIVFAALAVVGFSGGDAWITDYGRATAAFVLAAVMLVSAVTLPFTEQYARESVPESYWHTSTFRAINRSISALWGGIMLVTATSHTIASLLLSEGTTAGQVLLNWGVPVLLVFFGIKQTKKLSDAHHAPATEATTR